MQDALPGQITGLFVSPDGKDVAIEYDGGEGGLVLVDGTLNEIFEDLDSVPNDWTRWEAPTS